MSVSDLTLAAGSGRIATVKLLLNSGASIKVWQRSKRSSGSGMSHF